MCRHPPDSASRRSRSCWFLRRTHAGQRTHRWRGSAGQASTVREEHSRILLAIARLMTLQSSIIAIRLSTSARSALDFASVSEALSERISTTALRGFFRTPADRRECSQNPGADCLRGPKRHSCNALPCSTSRGTMRYCLVPALCKIDHLAPRVSVAGRDALAVDIDFSDSCLLGPGVSGRASW